MSMSLTPASSRHLVYCSSDKKSYIIDDYETQTRFGMKGSKGKYDFVMKDGNVYPTANDVIDDYCR